MSSLASASGSDWRPRSILNPILRISDSDLAALDFNSARKWLLIMGSEVVLLCVLIPVRDKGDEL